MSAYLTGLDRSCYEDEAASSFVLKELWLPLLCSRWACHVSPLVMFQVSQKKLLEMDAKIADDF